MILFFRSILDDLLKENGVYNNVTTIKKYELQLNIEKNPNSAIKDNPEFEKKLDAYSKSMQFTNSESFYPNLISPIVSLYECLSRKKLPTQEEYIRNIYNQAIKDLTTAYKIEFMFNYIKDIYNT